MEKEIISNYPYVKFIEIPTVKLIRSLTPKNLLLPLKLIKSIHIAKQKFTDIKPDIIFSKGGYVSIPVCIAGKLLKTPILTHESDFTIGLANKLIAPISKNICCSFKKVKLDIIRLPWWFSGSESPASAGALGSISGLEGSTCCRATESVCPTTEPASHK